MTGEDRDVIRKYVEDFSRALATTESYQQEIRRKILAFVDRPVRTYRLVVTVDAMDRAEAMRMVQEAKGVVVSNFIE